MSPANHLTAPSSVPNEPTVTKIPIAAKPTVVMVIALVASSLLLDMAV